MNIIEQVLDEAQVDWNIHEPSGLHMVSSSDFTPQLLTDISCITNKPMNSLNYGNFVVIIPNNETQQAIDIMRDFGFELNAKPIMDNKKKSKYDIDSIVEEVASEFSTQGIFKKFGKAMKVLGDQIGIGPIQDALKARGINWRMADDDSSLIFFIEKDGQEQRIARISAESISTEQTFSEQLINMVDFATGEAPGTFKQKQETMQKQKQVVSDISKSVFPTDNSSKVASIMMKDN